jgi:hypothetical protein
MGSDIWLVKIYDDDDNDNDNDENDNDDDINYGLNI